MLELCAKKRQGDFNLDVELQAGPGVTALFGPSGSGKTSVINLVAGLARPDQGRVVVDGRVLYDSKAGIDVPPDKRRLGYVFQEGRLFPHLDVMGNLRFGRDRLPKAERSVAFDDVIEVLGIDHLLERRPAGLSGGEKQRVAIGRALLACPRILLMDEPLAALDANRKAELLPFISSLSRRFAIPILYVSHAMDEVLQLADTLVLMDSGKVMAMGITEEVLSRADLRNLTGRGEAGAVIKAMVKEHDDAHGITELAFSGGRLLVAKVDLPVGSTVRLRVHARDVALATEAPNHISVRNVLPGRVVSVEEAPNHLVDVRLDCNGTILWSQITSLAQAHLQLSPGQSAFALLKSVTVAREDIAGRPEETRKP